MADKICNHCGHMREKTGIFIDKIDDKHIWLIYYHKGEKIFKQPLALAFRDHLKPIHQQDIDSGQVAEGYQPETSFEKLKIHKALIKELDIA